VPDAFKALKGKLAARPLQIGEQLDAFLQIAPGIGALPPSISRPNEGLGPLYQADFQAQLQTFSMGVKVLRERIATAPDGLGALRESAPPPKTSSSLI